MTILDSLLQKTNKLTKRPWLEILKWITMITFAIFALAVILWTVSMRVDSFGWTLKFK